MTEGTVTFVGLTDGVITVDRLIDRVAKGIKAVDLENGIMIESAVAVGGFNGGIAKGMKNLAL